MTAADSAAYLEALNRHSQATLAQLVAYLVITATLGALVAWGMARHARAGRPWRPSLAGVLK